MSKIPTWRYLPPLLFATGQALGGISPFISPESAILAFGIPPHIASSRGAQLSFMVYGSRATIIGVAMWVSYLRGRMQTVDLLMCLNAWGCVTDGYVAWLEGGRGKAVFRGVLGFLVGGWGLMGLTAWGS